MLADGLGRFVVRIGNGYGTVYRRDNGRDRRDTGGVSTGSKH